MTLTRSEDEAVLNKAVARSNIDHIHWYVHHYTHSNQQQGILSERISIRQPRSSDILNVVFMKEVNNQSLWIFDLGSQETTKILIRIIVRFQERDRQNPQNLNIDPFLD